MIGSRKGGQTSCVIPMGLKIDYDLTLINGSPRNFRGGICWRHFWFVLPKGASSEQLYTRIHIVGSGMGETP